MDVMVRALGYGAGDRGQPRSGISNALTFMITGPKNPVSILYQFKPNRTVSGKVVIVLTVTMSSFVPD